VRAVRYQLPVERESARLVADACAARRERLSFVQRGNLLMPGGAFGLVTASAHTRFPCLHRALQLPWLAGRASSPSSVQLGKQGASGGV
jgi:hypothetical protein